MIMLAEALAPLARNHHHLNVVADDVDDDEVAVGTEVLACSLKITVLMKSGIKT